MKMKCFLKCCKLSTLSPSSSVKSLASYGLTSVFLNRDIFFTNVVVFLSDCLFVFVAKREKQNEHSISTDGFPLTT